VRTQHILIWALLLSMTAGVCHGLEQIEIVVDNSIAMWGLLGAGPPRIVALRTALNEFTASFTPPRGDFELGLRVIGGEHDARGTGACAFCDLLLPMADFEFEVWRGILADLVPGGERCLVHAITDAASDFSETASSRRIVVVTAGSDTCHNDVAELASALGEGEGAVNLRIIGLGLDNAAANSLMLVAPTRNVTNVNGLFEALRWAALPVGTRPPTAKWLDLNLTREGTGIAEASVHLQRELNDEPMNLVLEGGTTRVRVEPGRYQATTYEPGQNDLVFAGLTVGIDGAQIDLDLSPIAPVTLDVDPQPPAAGGIAHIQYWGVPDGTNWLMLAAADSPPSEFLARFEVHDPSGEVAVDLPDSLLAFEARLAHGLSDDAFRIVGKVGFEARLSPARLVVPETIENRTPLVIEWSGSDLPGDHITITSAEGGDHDHATCLFTTAGSPLNLTSPVLPGKYMVRYVSRFGRVLARSSLDVYEVLATLEGPAEVAPGEDFAVGWEGPGASQDYITLAAPDAPSDTYLSWSPTSAGPSLRLRAPDQHGSYEVRYVRAADSEILARLPIEIVVVAIGLRVPEEVIAGTRFGVEWTGTSRDGDFVAITPYGAPERRHLDWAYTSAGQPISLAAPFKPGEYEVRYIAGDDLTVVASVPLRVR
jgi:Ca-activated chloride channel family protein